MGLVLRARADRESGSDHASVRPRSQEPRASSATHERRQSQPDPRRCGQPRESGGERVAIPFEGGVDATLADPANRRGQPRLVLATPVAARGSPTTACRCRSKREEALLAVEEPALSLVHGPIGCGPTSRLASRWQDARSVRLVLRRPHLVDRRPGCVGWCVHIAGEHRRGCVRRGLGGHAIAPRTCTDVVDVRYPQVAMAPKNIPPPTAAPTPGQPWCSAWVTGVGRRLVRSSRRSPSRSRRPAGAQWPRRCRRVRRGARVLSRCGPSR